MVSYSYLDRVEVGLLGRSSFHSILYTDHKLVRLRVKLDKPQVRKAWYWKLNTSLFGERDFQEQLLVMFIAGIDGRCG